MIADIDMDDVPAAELFAAVELAGGVGGVADGDDAVLDAHDHRIGSFPNGRVHTDGFIENDEHGGFVLTLEGGSVVGGEAVGEMVGRALQARDLGTGKAAAGSALFADLFPEDVLDLASCGGSGEDNAGVMGVVPPVDESSGDMGFAD